MDQINRTKLKQAVELLKMNDTIAAHALVQNVTEQCPDDVNAWWLAVHTAQSRAEKYHALQQVLRINPHHEKARSALQHFKAEIAQTPKPVVTNSRPITNVVAPKKNDVRRRVWLWRIAGLAAIWFVSFLMLDSFMGWGVLRPLEYALLGEPEVKGYVDPLGGESLAEDDIAIPIVHAKELTTTTGGMQINTIYRGEAHSYTIPARAGMELMIAVNFINDTGAKNVTAIEIWDAAGKLVARETRFEDFMSDADMDLSEIGGETGRMLEEQLNAMLAMRMITYSVPRDGHYDVVVVSRDGGPAGQYSLLITNESAALDGSLMKMLN